MKKSITVIQVSLVAGLIIGGFGLGLAKANSEPEVTWIEVQVAPQESWWEIIEGHNGSKGNMQQLVYMAQKENNNHPSQLRIGETILIPVIK